MSTLKMPNIFATKTGSANLAELDQNFNYLKVNLENNLSGITFDAGGPSSSFIGAPSLDCGGVT